MFVRSLGLHAFIMGVLMLTAVIVWIERQVGDGDEAELFMWLLPLHQQERLGMAFYAAMFLVFLGASMDAVGTWTHGILH